MKSITLEGIEGNEKIAKVMKRFRSNPPAYVGGIRVVAVEDYQTGIATSADGLLTMLELPKENVIKFKLADESWICIRPSGTEPKCKFYFAVRGSTSGEAGEVIGMLEDGIMGLVV